MKNQCKLCGYNEATTTTVVNCNGAEVASCEKCEAHHQDLDWQDEQLDLAGKFCEDYGLNYFGSPAYYRGY
jgi:ribosome-binding protein aMBF1 (putative translation factor)